jgi:hypothetical protein
LARYSSKYRGGNETSGFIPAENASLSPKFYDELRTLFPQLPDSDKAKTFWQICRNGLLHQATFSEQRAIYGNYGFASHDLPGVIYIDQNGNFGVHPVLFAKQVLEQIGSDFSTFEGASSAAPPLPTVGPYQIMPNTQMIIGTAAPVASGSLGGSPSTPPGRLETQLC